MRRSLATLSNCAAALAPALLAVLMVHAPSKPALSDSLVSDPSSAPSASPCSALQVAVHQSTPSGNEPGCEAPARTEAEIAEARAYVTETAEPGYTMTLQGPELAIERLHPEFVVRLANAIREARSAGLPFAGVLSAYRPPAFGVGGFSDKFNSLHTYGLAVDMRGIGRPGSPEAQTWHAIAARNGVVCPYGPRDRAEWNHCQPTSVKMILAANPLRETVSAAGPSDLESMFEAGNPLIASMASAAESLAKAEPTPARAPEDAADKEDKPGRQMLAHRRTKRGTRVVTARVTAKPVRHAKLGTRTGTGKTRVIVTEDGRRKSRSGGA
jgi:hypothetical protein